MTNRERLIKLLQYLYRNTDDDHVVTTGDLTKRILGEDTPAKRKTLKADIDSVVDAAELDIICQKGVPDKYNWGSRLFDVAEIKFLIDCVSASSILTESMSKRIVTKLQSLLSDHQSKKIISHLYIPKHLKTDNQQIFYTIDKLTDAINGNKKVSFQYWKYGPDKEKVMLSDEDFICIPYGLALENSRYYLVGYSDYLGKVVTYRIDRIRNLKILDRVSDTRQNSDNLVSDTNPNFGEKAPGSCSVVSDTRQNFDMEDYLSGAFRMFVGEHEKVTLECQNDKMSSIIDYFGQDVEITKVDEEHFCVAVDVKPGDTFYAWIFQAQGRLKIIGPENIKEEYRRRVLHVAGLLEEECI